MVTTILEIVNGALKLINSLWGAFKRTTSESIDEIKAKVRKQRDAEKNGERPKW